MSRNGSGTFISPAGNPVVTGTTIQSSVFNSTITDIGNELTNSLPRDGQAPMTAQLKITSGTVTIPGLAFNSESSTGLFWPSTGVMAFSVLGVEKARLDSAGSFTVSNDLPSIRAAALSTAGVPGLRVQDNTGVRKLEAVYVGTTAAVTYGASAGSAVINTNSSTPLVFSTADTARMTITAAGNVGINTLAPTQRFTIAGNASTSFYASWTNGTQNLIAGINSANDALIGSISNDPFSLWAGGAERARFLANGNFGIGTAAPARTLDVNGSMRLANSATLEWGGTSTAIAGESSTNTLFFTTGSAERMRIDSNGNVGIGMSGAYPLDVRGSLARISTAALTSNMYIGQSAVNGASAVDSGMSCVSGSLLFGTGGTLNERMRIDSTGVLMVNTTSLNAGVTNTCKLHVLSTGADYAASLQNSNASPFGLALKYTNTPNGTGNTFIRADDGTALRFSVLSNGGISNFSANNTNLSDVRTKKDIVPATPYLDKLMAIEVVTFKYKDQTDDLSNLGVIAQQVESVAPELVSQDGYGETPQDGVPLKAIYQTDVQYATIKALQEAVALIRTLTARVAELEAA